MNEQDNKSPQILNSASNLLGFCFVVLTSIRFFKLSDTTIIDEVTAICFVLFMFSCLCAFLSIRSKTKRADLYETLADYSFLAGLIVIFVMTLLFLMELIH
jgi:hypothetical protein